MPSSCGGLEVVRHVLEHGGQARRDAVRATKLSIGPGIGLGRCSRMHDVKDIIEMAGDSEALQTASAWRRVPLVKINLRPGSARARPSSQG